MQWLILIMASFAAMVLFMLAFTLKVHRTGKLHGCGHSDGCHCHGDSINTIPLQGCAGDDGQRGKCEGSNAEP